MEGAAKAPRPSCCRPGRARGPSSCSGAACEAPVAAASPAGDRVALGVGSLASAATVSRLERASPGAGTALELPAAAAGGTGAGALRGLHQLPRPRLAAPTKTPGVRDGRTGPGTRKPLLLRCPGTGWGAQRKCGGEARLGRPSLPFGLQPFPPTPVSGSGRGAISATLEPRPSPEQSTDLLRAGGESERRRSLAASDATSKPAGGPLQRPSAGARSPPPQRPTEGPTDLPAPPHLAGRRVLSTCPAPPRSGGRPLASLPDGAGGRAGARRWLLPPRSPSTRRLLRCPQRLTPAGAESSRLAAARGSSAGEATP